MSGPGSSCRGGAPERGSRPSREQGAGGKSPPGVGVFSEAPQRCPSTPGFTGAGQAQALPASHDHMGSRMGARTRRASWGREWAGQAQGPSGVP